MRPAFGHFLLLKSGAKITGKISVLTIITN